MNSRVVGQWIGLALQRDRGKLKFIEQLLGGGSAGVRRRPYVRVHFYYDESSIGWTVSAMAWLGAFRRLMPSAPEAYNTAFPGAADTASGTTDTRSEMPLSAMRDSKPLLGPAFGSKATTRPDGPLQRANGKPFHRPRPRRHRRDGRAWRAFAPRRAVCGTAVRCDERRIGRCGYQCLDVAKDATAHTILGQVPKEAFDRVSARRRRST